MLTITNIIYTDEHSYDIKNDFNEIKNLSIINQLKAKLENHKFYIFNKHDRITIDESFIKKFVTQIDWLTVDFVDLTSNQLESFTQVLSTSNIKVCFLVCLKRFNFNILF